MIENVVESFKKQSLWQKIICIKRIVIELVILTVGAILFFWGAIALFGTVFFFFSPSPYYHSFEPVYHVRQFRSDSLITLFVNDQLKESICVPQNSQQFFSDVTLPYDQFCNLKQQSLPQMFGLTNIFLNDADAAKIRYVSGCTRAVGQKMSCQKYPISERISLFRKLQLTSAYFIQIQLHLHNSEEIPSSTGLLEMVEQRSFVMRFIKDHFNLFSIIFAYLITIFSVIVAVLIRVNIIARNHIIDSLNQEQDQNKKILKNSNNSGGKLLLDNSR